jgi:hypothetical protein
MMDELSPDYTKWGGAEQLINTRSISDTATAALSQTGLMIITLGH